jgi:hypothetical protein
VTKGEEPVCSGFCCGGGQRRSQNLGLQVCDLLLKFSDGIGLIAITPGEHQPAALIVLSGPAEK